MTLISNELCCFHALISFLWRFVALLCVLVIAVLSVVFSGRIAIPLT
jgi:hypothetical protein